MGNTLLGAAKYAQYGNLRVELINRFRTDRPRRLLLRPMPMRAGYSPRRINRLLSAFPAGSGYLEIGVLRGFTFENVEAATRCGVEPRPRFDTTRLPPGASIYIGTSDDFFSTLDGTRQFDLVFLDGLHTFRQTYRDLINALRVCPSGLLLIDDVVPADSASAIPDRDEAIEERKRRQIAGPNMWHGDVFKVVVAVSRYHASQLNWCTIIDKGNPQTIVWRKSPGEEVQAVDDAALDTVDATTFDEVFGSGIPDYFVPKVEEAAVASAVQPLATRPDATR
jgi:hypothetical protein